MSGLGGFIREQRDQAQMSLRQLAKAADVSNPYLSQVERGLRRPSAEILNRIAQGLRISSETLYVQAGILEERDETNHDLVAEVRRDPWLSEEQKKTVIQIYETFRAERRSAGFGPPPPATDELEGNGDEDPEADPKAAQTRSRPKADRPDRESGALAGRS